MDHETSSMENDAGSNRLVCVLDEIERRVEQLRIQAVALTREKEDLLQCLHSVSESEDARRLSTCDREELEANAFRLTCRCLTVNVSVTVPRDEEQEEALQKVHKFIESTLEETRPEDRKKRIQSLLNASTSEPIGSSVPQDQKFQSILLGCTADDQKFIRRHLLNLLEEKSGNVSLAQLTRNNSP